MHAYSYDFRNLMTDYDGPGSTNDTTYKYDALGRRITKNVNGTKTGYSHDGLDSVAEYNRSNQLKHTYVTPGLDQNLSLTASENTYYYLSDALGSVRQLLDADQATQDSYDYQAFGSAYGTPTENVTNRLRFTGRESILGGLYDFRIRVYIPQLGAFASREPIRTLGVKNARVFARNCPTFYIDPTGSTVVASGLNALRECRRSRFFDRTCITWSLNGNCCSRVTRTDRTWVEEVIALRVEQMLDYDVDQLKKIIGEEVAAVGVVIAGAGFALAVTGVGGAVAIIAAGIGVVGAVAGCVVANNAASLFQTWWAPVPGATWQVISHSERTFNQSYIGEPAGGKEECARHTTPECTTRGTGWAVDCDLPGTVHDVH